MALGEPFSDCIFKRSICEGGDYVDAVNVTPDFQIFTTFCVLWGKIRVGRETIERKKEGDHFRLEFRIDDGTPMQAKWGKS